MYASYHHPHTAYAAAPPRPPRIAPPAQPATVPTTGKVIVPPAAPAIPPPTAPATVDCPNAFQTPFPHHQ